MPVGIHRISRKRYRVTMLWALFLSMMIVAAAAFLARATLNMKAALVSKPNIAIYQLLPELKIGHTELLRDNGDERWYLAETNSGTKLVTLKKGATWYVESVENMH